MIIKQIGQRLNIYECIQLLDKVAEYGIIKRDDRNGENLKVFRGTAFGGGSWISVPIIDCAAALANDLNGQTFLRERLKNYGVELVMFSELEQALCTMA